MQIYERVKVKCCLSEKEAHPKQQHPSPGCLTLSFLRGSCLFFSNGWFVPLSVMLMVLLYLAQRDGGVPLACWSLGPRFLFLCGCRIFWKWLWFNGSANHSWPLNSRCPTGEELERNLCLDLFGERPRAQGRNDLSGYFSHSVLRYFQNKVLFLIAGLRKCRQLDSKGKKSLEYVQVLLAQLCPL